MADDMTRVRPPAVAGLFYPDDPTALRAMLESELDEARAAPHAPEAAPVAIIAPHAGYVYSGPIAAYAYEAVASLRGVVRRVLLLGPCHRFALRGMAVPEVAAFETPLGIVSVDAEMRRRLLELPFVVASDRVHAEEHSLEVQLPFIQEVLGDVSVLPVAIGTAVPEDVASAIERVWDVPDVLVVASSDLSHYLDYDEAVRRDRRTTEAIERCDVEAIGLYDACGAMGIRGLLTVAKLRGLPVRTLDLRNSGDTAGPRDRVVGYGAYAIG